MFIDEFEPRARTRSQLSTSYSHSLTVDDRSPSAASLLSDSTQVVGEDNLIDEPEDQAGEDYKMIEEEKAETGRVRLYIISSNTYAQN